MSFLLGFLGAILGIIVIIVVIIICIMIGVSKSMGINDLKTIFNAAKNTKQIAKEDAYRQKNVSGMTVLLEPEILRDFPYFNKDLLYSIAEKNLRKIFSAIENKSLAGIDNDKDLMIITDTGIVIRLAVDKISTMSRVTQGVKLINLKEDSIVSSTSIVDR